MRLATDYFDEMARCEPAYFAAGVIGCAVVESMLLLACIRDRESVLLTTSWKSFARKQKRHGQLFLELLFWIDLGNLILIGKELGWFNVDEARTKEFFESLLDSEQLREVDKTLPEIYVSPLVAIQQLQKFRNMIHPGKCVREGSRLVEKNAKLSAGLVYVSLMGILDFYRGERLSSIDLEVPLSLRERLGWSKD